MSHLMHLAPLAATFLITAIWQSSLLAVCVAVALHLLPGITAAARSLLWTAVFLLTLVLPFAHVAITDSSATTASTGLRVDPRWAVTIAALWAVCSLVRATRLLLSAFRLYRIATRSTAVVPNQEFAALLNSTRRPVRLCTSAEVDVPSVAGFFRPRILLPPGLFASISPEDLRQVILHELEHLRRHDDWTNLLQELGLVLFPLNPVLIWMERRLCLERELACDDGVLRATDGAAKAYATCLANLAEASLLRRGLSLALGAWRHQSELTLRVHRILRDPQPGTPPSPATAFAVLTLAAVLGSGLLAVRVPQLISFTAANTPYLAEAARATTSSFHPTLVNAIMPRTSRPAALSVTRVSHRPRTSATAVRRRSRPSKPNLVLIGWPQQSPRGHWTLAAYPTFTYAAVSTPNGWLLIQL